MTPDHPRISINQAVLAGKPVISGTRLSVEFIIGLIEEGWHEADILANYPIVTDEGMTACLSYAGEGLEVRERQSVLL